MHPAQAAGMASSRGKWIFCIMGLALQTGLSSAPADNTPIEIGILPTLSTRTILANYQPLREYVQERLGQPVTLVTAKDYRTFLDRTQRGEYSFVITAPHFARLAQSEAGYVPMVRLKRELQAIIVVRTNSNIQSLGALRGKRVGTPDDTAMLTMLGLQLLRNNGLEPGKNVTVQAYTSLNSTVLSVQNGDNDAAVTAQTALNQMPEEMRSGLRIIGTSSSVPHMIYLANRKVPPKDIARMTRILLDFADDDTRGQQFLKQTGFLGIVRPTAEELKNLDPYVTELKRRLAAP